MKKENKEIILSVILWLSFSIPYSRWGHHNDNMGEYTLAFLDMLQGVLSFILCLWLSNWFIRDKTK